MKSFHPLQHRQGAPEESSTKDGAYRSAQKGSTEPASAKGPIVAPESPRERRNSGNTGLCEAFLGILVKVAKVAKNRGCALDPEASGHIMTR